MKALGSGPLPAADRQPLESGVAARNARAYQARRALSPPAETHPPEPAVTKRLLLWPHCSHSIYSSRK